MEPVKEHKNPLRGLLVAQFFGAFNDNALKVFVALLAMRNLTVAPGTAAYEAASQAEATKAFVALTLPLMLASLPAAYIADRFSKRSVIIGMKFIEILLMASVGYNLYLHPADRLLPFAILAFMGAQSALFSPAKFGLLPEVLPHNKLSEGNGLLQMWTMLAIIAGTAVAGPLSDAFGASRPWVVGVVFAVLAVAGFFAALTVPKVPPARAKGDRGGTFRDAFAAIREDRVLRLAILGAAYLWAIASLLGQDILVYSKATLGLSDTLSGLPLAVLGVGIAIGSVLAARLSAGKVEYGLIPAGAVGMTLVTLALGLFGPGVVGTNILMLLLGTFGGLILVPIHAVMQWRAPAARRGAVIAVANILVYAGILVGSLSAYGMSLLGVPPRGSLPSARARARYPHDLQDAPRASGAHPRRGPGAVDAEPRIVRRRAPHSCEYRPAGTVRRRRALLQHAAGEAVHAVAQCHPAIARGRTQAHASGAQGSWQVAR